MDKLDEATKRSSRFERQDNDAYRDLIDRMVTVEYDSGNDTSVEASVVDDSDFATGEHLTDYERSRRNAGLVSRSTN